MPLARYLRPITDAAGNLIPNVHAEAREATVGGRLLRLKSDRNGLVGIDNPAFFPDGIVSFHAAGTPFHLHVWAEGYDETFEYQAVGTGAERDFGFFAPQGQYDPDESYDLDALVEYGDAVFISAIANNLGNLPTISPEPASNAFWMLLPFGGFFTADYIDLPIFAQGQYDSGDLLARYQFPSDVTFPAGLTGSVASAGVAGDGAASLPILRNGVEVGTIDFADGDTEGVFTFPDEVIFFAGDVIEIEAPSPHVDDFADFTATIRGVRNASVGVTPTGKTTIDFGAFPGKPYATKQIAGQGTIDAGATVEAWLVAAATADHSADEHRIADIEIRAGEIVPGVGFTVSAKVRGGGENGPRMYGLWTIAWRWAS